MSDFDDISLILTGASVRAAAASALRAGHRPGCIDLFGDADLVRARPTRVVALDQYPHGLIDAVADGPNRPWMYTGGLENFPTLLARPSQPLCGNSVDIVRAVRDPIALFHALKNLDAPLVGDRADPTTRWLVKPRHGSAGFGIRPWRLGDEVPQDCYLQEHIAGEPASAVFVGHAGSARLLGVTRQLIGASWLHAPGPFSYAGTIGPLDCPLDRLQSVGQTLVNEFDLRGVFGVDFILDGDRIRPIEVNPRYPASFEILERIARQPLLRYHLEAFGDLVGQVSNLPIASATLPDGPRRGERGAGWKPTLRSHGKAILFAESDVVFPGEGPWNTAMDHSLADLDVPFADIPATGQRIPRGSPVLTFFASANSSEECEAELRKIALDLDRALAGR